MIAAAQRKPFEPLVCKRPRGANEPWFASRVRRNRSVSAMVSEPAHDALFQCGLRHGDAPIGSMVGLVADYLARTGQFEALLEAAIAEAKQ